MSLLSCHSWTILRHVRGKNLSGRPLLFLCVFFAMILVLIPGTVFADSAGSKTTVRIGYFDNGDFMHTNANGAYEGYDIEFYYTVAGYADWNVKFVKCDSLNDATAKLESGDIDILSGMSKTSDRESRFLFSNNKMCTSRISVQTRADDDRFAAGDPSTMKNMTCGVLKGSNVVTLYTNWCAANGITPHIIEYDSLAARNSAFQSGKVDAVAAGSTIEGAQRIAEFPTLDLYFMLNRSRTDLKVQLDRAMGILSLENPEYMQDLFTKYFPATKNTKPSFSSSEKSYMKKHRTIKVALLDDDEPFSTEKSGGSMDGILPDYFRHVSKVTGMEFKCVPFSSEKAMYRALADGKVDVMGKLENDVYDANSRGLILTNPYLSMNMVRITRAGEKSVGSTSVSTYSSRIVKKEMAGEEPDVKVKVYSNGKSCFDALKSGKVDSMTCTQPAASWLLGRNRASEYVVISFYGSDCDIVCGIKLSADGNTLRSIIDKTVAVDDGYINQLITTGLLKDSANISTLFSRMPASMIIALAAIAICLFVIAVIALLIIMRRHKAEAEIARSRAELAVREETNKARHDFFGNVSHDMRTPLNGIVGFTDLALRSNDIDEIKDYLAKIRVSGSTLSALVDDTLIMSRIQNDKYVLEPSPGDLREIIEEVLAPVRGLADAKNIVFEDEITGTGPWTVMTDKLSFQKMILNLLSNAIKFTPEGGTVTFRCSAEPSDGILNSTISVSDSGVGISEEFRSHIFEPFAQESPSNSRNGGSGMGLSIVKSIVDAMGGTIDVKSRKNEGTEFTVRTGMSMCDPTVVTDADHDVSAEVLHGRNVLVCEDNTLNMEILRSILESAGMAVDGAENGREGLDMFIESSAGHYDFIIMDLRMPVMDGNSAAAAIRSLDRDDARTVRIIAVSADAYPENIQECLDAGMDVHISKPVDAGRLISTLVELSDSAADEGERQ